MILINSIKKDPSTNKVIDWIKHYNEAADVFRHNPEDLIFRVSIDFENQNNLGVRIDVNCNRYCRIIELDEVKSYWYRRGEFNFSLTQTSNRMEHDIYTFLNEEWLKTSEFINKRLLEKRKLGDVADNKINKFEVLFIASGLGIDIPRTFISTQPVDRDNLVSKGIYHNCFIIDGKHSVGSFTIRVDDFRSSSFFPSQFQKEIPKLYELRIFYLFGKFYTSVIFSQENQQTEVDFRDYDKQTPNRVVPYQLPEYIEVKLKKLMTALKLETGSIDMIVTPEKKYVFLEVNPIGQFDQVSVPCNYHLEEKIANYLLYGEN
jgi:ATP-GRASP peptide maturase of grasp-with-spasm system